MATVTLRNIRFRNRGFCWQSNYFAGRREWRVRRFAAVVVSFEHPLHGRCQIDTGYGRAVLPATRYLPQRVLRWVTPLPTRSWPLAASEIIPAEGAVGDGPLDYLFLSHFHIDHIGGLLETPAQNLVYRRSTWNALQRSSGWQQLHQGFLLGLVPPERMETGHGIDDVQWEVSRPDLAGLATFDFWGDGSLLLVDLPGHSLGHFGFLLRGERETCLYAVDAFWDYEVYQSQRQLPWLGRRVQHDYAAYCQTLNKLWLVERELQPLVLACHCERTQQYVER